MTTGLCVGRFQPFHLGHLRMLEFVLERVDNLIVVVGSSQYRNEPENPFSFEERKRMITESLGEHGDRITVVAVPDVHDDSRWVREVLELAPGFDVVYSNSQLERKLFSDAGFKVEDVPFFYRGELDASEIRRFIREGGRWQNLVPDGSRRVIGEVNGVKRIKELG